MKSSTLASLFVIATLIACNTQEARVVSDRQSTDSNNMTVSIGNSNAVISEIFATNDVKVIDSLRALYSSNGVNIDSLIQLHDTQYLKASVKEEIRTMLSAP